MIHTISYNFAYFVRIGRQAHQVRLATEGKASQIGIGIDHQESFKAEAVSNVKILSYNPGHDGAIAFLQDARLMMSIEAEKDSNYRYSPVSSPDVLNALGDIDEIPDVICTSGWWPRDHYEYLHGSDFRVGRRGVAK